MRVRVMLAAIACCATLLSVACGAAPTESAEEMPGYTDRERQVDDSPFALARPGESGGPTTLYIPDDRGRGRDRPEQTEFTTTTTTATTTTTTTTTLPSEIAMTTSSDPVCRAFSLVASGIRASQNRFAEHAISPGSVSFLTVRRPLDDGLDAAIRQLDSAMSDGASGAVTQVLQRRLRSTAQHLASMTTFEQVGGVLTPLITPAFGPGETVGWTEIEVVLNQQCPDLLVALTGTSTLNNYTDLNGNL